MQAVVMKTSQSKGKRWSASVVLLSPETFDSLKLVEQSQVVVRDGTNRALAWVYRDSAVMPNEAQLSRKCLERLGDTRVSEVAIEIPDHRDLTVVPALVGDLPDANEIDISKEDLAAIGSAGHWALAVNGRWSIPVRLRVRKVLPGRIRMAMLMRTLLSVDRLEPSEQASQTVRLCRMMQDSSNVFARIGQYARIRHVPRVGALVIIVGHAAVEVLERMLRVWLRAPVVALRTTEALVGDDNNHVVRLAGHVFPLIGISPGAHVVIEWGDRRVIATALESVTVSADDRRILQSLQAVDLATTSTDDNFSHLSIGITAEMRVALSMPRRTVVAVRRRVVPVLLGRLNDLTIPVGGLLLAAATIQGVSRRLLAAAAVVVTLLALMPARYRKPPRGPWPF